MIHSIKELEGLKLAASDGVIGRVKEAYFDDRQWQVRHLVVDTGGWLAGRRVLISPSSVRAVDAAQHQIEVALSKAQIEQAPGIDNAIPASRQHIASAPERGERYLSHWEGSGRWGILDAPLAGSATPAVDFDPSVAHEVEAAERDAVDPDLHSSAETIGYAIEARDGTIGHIADLLFDASSWQIRFAVVDIHHWLRKRHVLVSPQWIERVNWSARRAVLRVTRRAVATSPVFERRVPLSEDGLVQVQRHFEKSE